MGHLADDLHEELKRLAAAHGRFDAIAALLSPRVDEHGVFRIAGRLRPIEFRRFRRRRTDDGARRLAGSFRIDFGRNVIGPVCLGHSSHFGMGLFMPLPAQGAGSSQEE
jgi:CRISPR-associated protein Csb2